MSVIVLVRHGQARAFSSSPDRLSARGWDQAHRLGDYWAERGTRFDMAFHGTLRRQRETCEAVAAAFGRAGRPFPAAQEVAGLNEYDTQDLIAVIAPRLAETDAQFAPLWDAWSSDRSGADSNRRFQLMFEALVARWVDGRLVHPGLEPWVQFRSRAERAMRYIREFQGRGARGVAFTSGGPIGVAVQSCLQAPALAALEVNWRVRNTSLTSFLYSGSRVSLDGFNELPHLASDPHLVTFR